jgi:hypothetical protein
MSTPAATATRTTASPVITAAPTAVLQRTCGCGQHTTSGGECEECKKKQMLLQRHSTGAAAPMTIPSVVHQVLGSTGRPLGPDIRGFMEPRFGHDFSNVQVHTDTRAAESARAVNALAYTVGDHIAFEAGQYDPSSGRGRRLLAHELTHVVQNRNHANRTNGSLPAISDPADSSEQEASSASQRIISGESVEVAQAPNALVHRDLKDVGKAIGIGALVAGGVAAVAGAIKLAICTFRSFDDTELQAYLSHLADTRAIEDNCDSDIKAREVVKRWRAKKSGFDLDSGYKSKNATLSAVEVKRLLIQEALSGITADADEKSILSILEGSTDNEILQILDPLGGVSLQDLDDNIQGANHDQLEALLEKRFPTKGAPQITRSGGYSCTARQALMASYAQQSAIELADNAITMLSTRAEDPKVKSAIDCRFRGATPAQIAAIRAVFVRARRALPTRQYFCGGEGAAEMQSNELRSKDGTVMVADCVVEDADSFVRKGGGTTRKEVFLCGVFFRRSPEEQAMTLLHESVHAAGLLEDPAYQPGCGIALDTALINPDSYSYLANDLIQSLPSAKAPAGSKEPGPRLPTIAVGNFRNHGPLSPENQCPVCPDLPGLGLDQNTALNIMELRGDISEHRRGIEYDFKRSKERVIWRNTNNNWDLLDYLPPGTPDDATDRDEDLRPKNNHIYSIDGPGFEDVSNPLPGAAAASEAVYKGTYTDWVEARIRNGPWTKVSNDFDWHSITWLEKVGGAWRRKAGWNEIEAGKIMVGRALPYGPGDYVPPAHRGEEMA